MVTKESLSTLSRFQKRAISALSDLVFIVIAYWSALILKSENIIVFEDSNNWLLLFIVSPVAIMTFYLTGLYRTILRYMGLQVLTSVLAGVFISSIVLVFFAYVIEHEFSKSVLVIYSVLSFLLIVGIRGLIRIGFSTAIEKEGELVIIYGAGVSGRQLVSALTHGHEYRPYCFLDDNLSLHGSVIQGLKVCCPSEVHKLLKELPIAKVLLAMPSTTHSRRQQILEKLEHLPVQILTLPAMAELVNGEKLYSEIKDVDIDDLLGRDSVDPRTDLMTRNVSGKVVMVTGAGGSIGSELCRQIIKQSPKKLILFELSEYALYSIEKELNELQNNTGEKLEILPILGNVQHKKRIQVVMESFGVQTVYHAAAYKHVPLVEHNVVEGLENNVFGTTNTALAAIAAKVDTFVLISTDKAVRPTNIMGTTKRMAELALQALAKEKHDTCFCMVRFGNVLGSSGSVVPLFRNQIANGGPITVTHPEITRYFMTIPEASQLVIQAGAMGQGGDVFVLDMGQSVKIVDLASKMIRLSGLQVRDKNSPNGDIAINFSGLRPGEKLFEELLIGDNVSDTAHERIMTAQEAMLPWHEYLSILDDLESACHEFNHEKIREFLLSAPTGFNPTDGICDLVWAVHNKDKTNEVT